MSEYDRIDQYHPDNHHYSNWCRKCGIYYCWHVEANHGIPLEEYKHHIIRHPFSPMRSEHDYYDWYLACFIPKWLFFEENVIKQEDYDYE